MSSAASLQVITTTDLVFALTPVVVVAVIYMAWLKDKWLVAYAALRMVLQLLLVGYALQYLFARDIPPLTLIVICVMVAAAVWIALRPVNAGGSEHLRAALVGIGLGGTLNLVLVVALVLHERNWSEPSLLIPLAGMVYANAMNTVSLCAERYLSERIRGLDYLSARNAAFQAGMLPQVNSLLAVGLVSLPGMMTGQILSGVSPLIAVRYQIVVMCMILGSAGLAAALYLQVLKRQAKAQSRG